jgi:hypothetical protein
MNRAFGPGCVLELWDLEIRCTVMGSRIDYNNPVNLASNAIGRHFFEQACCFRVQNIEPGTICSHLDQADIQATDPVPSKWNDACRCIKTHALIHGSLHIGSDSEPTSSFPAAARMSFSPPQRLALSVSLGMAQVVRVCIEALWKANPYMFRAALERRTIWKPTVERRWRPFRCPEILQPPEPLPARTRKNETR